MNQTKPSSNALKQTLLRMILWSLTLTLILLSACGGIGDALDEQRFFADDSPEAAYGEDEAELNATEADEDDEDDFTIEEPATDPPTKTNATTTEPQTTKESTTKESTTTKSTTKETTTKSTTKETTTRETTTKETSTKKSTTKETTTKTSTTKTTSTTKSNTTSKSSASTTKAKTTKATTPKTTSSSAAIVVPQPGIVYITKTGSKYHESGCKYLKKSKNDIPLAETIALGYEPCKVCY